jgi:hypothetical protein
VVAKFQNRAQFKNIPKSILYIPFFEPERLSRINKSAMDPYDLKCNKAWGRRRRYPTGSLSRTKFTPPLHILQTPDSPIKSQRKINMSFRHLHPFENKFLPRKTIYLDATQRELARIADMCSSLYAIEALPEP